MRETLDEVTLHSFAFAPVFQNEMWDLANINLDATFKYRGGIRLPYAVWISWYPPPEELTQPIFLCKLPIPIPPWENSVREEGPPKFRSMGRKNGVDHSVAPITGGNRVALGAAKWKLEQPLWPGAHLFRIEFGIDPNNAAIPKGQASPSTAFFRDLRATKPEINLRMGVQTQKNSFAHRLDMADPGNQKPKHGLRWGNTNLATLGKIKNQLAIEMQNQIVVYTARYTGFPIVDLQSTLGFPLQKHDMHTPLLEFLAKATKEVSEGEIGGLLWSPIYNLNVFNDDQLQLELAEITQSSKRMAEQGEGIGSSADIGLTPEDVKLSREEAVLFALDALRTDPNNIHAHIIVSFFAALTGDMVKAYDFFVSAYLKLKLWNRISKETSASIPKTIVDLAKDTYIIPSTKSYLELTAMQLGLEDHLEMEFDAVWN